MVKHEDNFKTYSEKLNEIINNGEGLLTQSLTAEQQHKVQNIVNNSRIKLLELEFNNLK